MFAWLCVLPPLLAGVLLRLVGPEDETRPAEEETLSARTLPFQCGWLQEQRGLQPGAVVGTLRLRHCLGGGSSAEVWLARYRGEGGADVAVKILKSNSSLSRLQEECEVFDWLRRDGVTRVPGCLEFGQLDLDGTRLGFSTRELVPGRTVSDMIWEADRLWRIPAELARLRTAFRVVLGMFEVIDSGMRSCTVASSRGCRHIVDLHYYNVMLTLDGRVFVVDFDMLGPDPPQYFDQTSPISFHERLKECQTRSLFWTLLQLLLIGMTTRTPPFPHMEQLFYDLEWRGSRLHHCRDTGYEDFELESQAEANVSEDWQWDGLSPLSEKRRQPTLRDMDIVSTILSEIHPAYRKDWARLEGGREVLLDALASIRSYEIHWPPRFISSLQQWLELLDGRAAEI